MRPRASSSQGMDLLLILFLRLAARSITDLLYYHFGMVIVCLVLSDVLLFRIDGLK